MIFKNQVFLCIIFIINSLEADIFRWTGPIRLSGRVFDDLASHTVFLRVSAPTWWVFGVVRLKRKTAQPALPADYAVRQSDFKVKLLTF
jgi:hypothetical protein